MDKIYLKMLEGSTYIYRTEPWVEKPTKYEVGDYLLSDLKTIVKQSELTEDQKADVVGICIGENPVNHKNVFWYVDCFSSSADDGTFVKDGYKFLSGDDSTLWYKYDTGNLVLKDGTIYPWRKFVKDPTSMPAQEDVYGICIGQKDMPGYNSRVLCCHFNSIIYTAGSTDGQTEFYGLYDPDHNITNGDNSVLVEGIINRRAAVETKLSGDMLSLYRSEMDKFESYLNDILCEADHVYVPAYKEACIIYNVLKQNSVFMLMANAHEWLYNLAFFNEGDMYMDTISHLNYNYRNNPFNPTDNLDMWYLALSNNGIIDEETYGESNFNNINHTYGILYPQDDEDSSYKIEDGILNIYYKEEDNGKNPWNPTTDVNTDVITGMPGYITSTRNYNDWDSDEHRCVNDFAGKQNTIEWYKQMTAAGYNVATDMPALKALMDINGVESLDDDFDGWFLGSTGYMNLIASFSGDYSEEKEAEAQELRNKFNASLKNLNLERFADVDNPLDSLNFSEFWGSTFYWLNSGYSDVHNLDFYLGGGSINGNDVDSDSSLFAIIER